MKFKKGYCWGDLQDTLGLISIKVPRMSKDIRLRAIAQNHLQKLGWPAATVHLVVTRNLFMDSGIVKPRGQGLLKALIESPIPPYHNCSRLPLALRASIVANGLPVVTEPCLSTQSVTDPHLSDLEVMFPQSPFVTVPDAVLKRYGKINAPIYKKPPPSPLVSKPTRRDLARIAAAVEATSSSSSQKSVTSVGSGGSLAALEGTPAWSPTVRLERGKLKKSPGVRAAITRRRHSVSIFNTLQP